MQLQDSFYIVDRSLKKSSVCSPPLNRLQTDPAIPCVGTGLREVLSVHNSKRVLAAPFTTAKTRLVQMLINRVNFLCLWHEDFMQVIKNQCSDLNHKDKTVSFYAYTKLSGYRNLEMKKDLKRDT